MVSVRTITAVSYVRDLELARRFYLALGFTERRARSTESGSYCYLAQGDCTVLVTQMDPPPVTAGLPLALYLWVDDVSAAQATLAAAGYAAEHVGFPAHAPGGEVRTADPDGNVILLGQAAAVVADTRPPATGGFSLLQEAAARNARLLARADRRCQIGETGGGACEQPAEVKLADPWGDTAWSCLVHAEETLLNARSAFVAADDGHGLAAWLAARRQPTSD
jgi:catechol 2,3-dioxygenase-like lactoylglutathione lyase family enzyme